MKPSLSLLPLTAALLLVNGFAGSSLASSPPPIPMNQLGAVAGKKYQGDGLSLRATATGAELRCAFQRLEGEVTTAGLWLRSTADGTAGERFRVRAVAVGREFGAQYAAGFGVPPSGGPARVNAELQTMGLGNLFPFAAAVLLPDFGSVNVTDDVAQFRRPGVTEEYSVSVDGVRQDFLIAQPPAGTGELRLELDVAGATVEPLGTGARLTLSSSGRQLAYHRLHVTDATGRELPARMEVAAERLVATKLAVLVDDANAVYPVRIDPTFSDADWISMGGLNGADSFVSALAADDLGNLYIGGHFTVIGDVLANRVAKWDGNVWAALGAGIGGDSPGYPLALFYPIVTRLTVFGTNLYAAGHFSTAGGEYATNIAKWDGTEWASLGDGLNGPIYALASDGINLYAGGYFTTAGGNAADYIAKWDGNAWSALGIGVDNPVRALVVSGTNLYVGGIFHNAGIVPASGIAKWNGSEWSAVGNGVGGSSPGVFSLEMVGGILYAGGEFTSAGGVPANRIAMWNGTTWSALGSGMNSTVSSLAASGTNLYASGSFTTAGGTTANRIAKWNGSAWSALGSGVESDVVFGQTLEIFGTELYAAGGFTSIGGIPANYLAKWDGANWSSLLPGTDAGPVAMTVLNSDLYIGGNFTQVAGVPANRVAKWNGSVWSALGSGMNAQVEALTTIGTDLYAGGAFTNAGGVNANHIAKWDGIEWSALGVGVNDRVSALAVLSTNLYAGGYFTEAGGASAKGIAKWNGSAWSPLNSGMEGSSVRVSALTTLNGSLYAGGLFATAGGVTVSNIAKWDGNNWSALGSGMNNAVLVLQGMDDQLYAGGYFSMAGGIAANRIAKWNGNEWMSLGAGLEHYSLLGLETAKSMVVIGTNLYVGGDFFTAGGAPAQNIAMWDGDSWSALGSGFNSSVSALAVSSGNFFVGGNFTLAGGKVSAHLARVIIGNPPFPGRFNSLKYSSSTGFSGAFLDASIGQPYRIQTSPSLAGPWTDFTNFVYTGPVVISDPAPLVGTNKFFRAVTP
jgi:hypothetical protein